MAAKAACFSKCFQKWKSCNYIRRNTSLSSRNPIKNELEETGIKVNSTKSPLFSHDLLASNIVKKTDATVNPGSIYVNYPNKETTLVGKKPKIRMVWEEQDCSESFPASPEEANLDLVHYLEQRDMWMRQRMLHIPKFCVGSIIAVTRGDMYAPDGFTRFVGLCINKNTMQNTKGANFILRNVIEGEALEIQYPIYNPLIQKIEVLRHERWENEIAEVGLRFLRDYPIEYSTVNESMGAEEYTEEPKIRLWTSEDKEKLKKWFEMIYQSRRRR